MNLRRSSFAVFCLALGLVVVGSSPVAAQKQPPLTPNPQAPVLAMPTPSGAQRGTAVDVTLTGTNLADPVAVWTDLPGCKVSIPTDANNGKDNGKLRVKFEVPKESPLGYFGIRLATRRGVSNLRLFCVDDLPQVVEVDSNRSKTTPQAVPVPCVVLGRADAEASDYFKVTAKAGQRISFEVIGHRLGSAFDPQLTLYDAKTGRELPAGHSNDAPGLQTDPRLTYVFKDAGDYVVEVRDVSFRGGADFWYRLRIGDFPCATTPIPMAAKRGSKVMVQFTGPMVEGVAPVEVAVPADPQAEVVWVAPRGANGLLGWPVALAVSDLDEVVEQEPNNELARANRVPVPGAVTGRIQERGDVDEYVFPLKKGTRYVIDAQTHELYSPAEVYLVVKNPTGGEVGRTNPAAAPRLDFTAAVDGDFNLHVEHLHQTAGWGGPTESYRVTIMPFAPTFSLSVGIDRFDVPQGGFAVPTVNAARNGYNGPIEVSVVGTPGLSGQSVIDAGQAAVMLPLSAKPDAMLGAYPVTFQGKAVIDGKTVVRRANVGPMLSAGLGGLVHPPLQFDEQLAIGVTEKPPFTLTFRFDPPEVLRGATAGVIVSAVRGPGFMEDIVLTPVGLPPNVAPVVKNVAKNTNDVKVELKPAANAPLGSFPITFTGKAKFQNRDYLVVAGPASLVLTLPVELKVEPAPLVLAPGAKAKVKVTAVRKAGYQGPIDVELKNLPANVTAPKAQIAMAQTVVEIEVSAAPNAAIATKADVNVVGIATAAGNQQVTSPNFTINVKK